ncbi:MAG TPA: glycerol-3-phosphate 1-O-acyltransferase PlsY [Candidatus Aminicenantes bacterium]|nr:glycerol-3-phosphate 1-O-acyltransferase PlsY [Candidatus Aminicenantes bacterium]
MKALYVLLSYLIGALPSGYLVFRIFERKDIRKFGSGNTGATNMLRLKGWSYALPVAFLDVFKGFLPPFLALKILRDPTLAAILAAAAVAGHCFPVYIHFRGGKGVAPAMGSYLALSFWPFLAAAAAFLAAIILTRYVSLGSLAAAFVFPLASYIIEKRADLLALGLAVFILIAVRHAGNIRRLLAGTERKLGERKI